MSGDSQRSELSAYGPSEASTLLELTLEPPAPTPLRTWALLLIMLGGLALWIAKAVSLMAAAAAALPVVFLIAGLTVIVNKPTTTVLRFLEEGIELTTVARGWVRIPWDLVTRMNYDATGGATLRTGDDDSLLTLARLPKEEVERLVGASILPDHVERVPAPLPKESPRTRSLKTLLLWLVLIAGFVVVYSLVGQE